MPRYKLIIEYHGAPYAGWQRQKEQPSVQEALQIAIFKFSAIQTDVIGAGRTDAGVHALAQVAHIDLPKDLEAFQVMQGINYYLFNPDGGAEQSPLCTNVSNHIAVIAAERVGDNFNARFSAKQRYYMYRIINRRSRLGLEAGRAWHVIEPLDEIRMQHAADMLVGTYDFTSFRDTQCQAKSPIKTLEHLKITRHKDELHITASARSFLHHQVRIMVGSLALVGKGRWSVEEMRLARDAKERAKGGPTAPPEGLYLTHVDY